MNKRKFKNLLTNTCHVSSERRELDSTQTPSRKNSDLNIVSFVCFMLTPSYKPLFRSVAVCARRNTSNRIPFTLISTE